MDILQVCMMKTIKKMIIDEVRCNECGMIYKIKKYGKNYIFCNRCKKVIFEVTK